MITNINIIFDSNTNIETSLQRFVDTQITPSYHAAPLVYSILECLCDRNINKKQFRGDLRFPLGF